MPCSLLMTSLIRSKHPHTWAEKGMKEKADRVIPEEVAPTRDDTQRPTTPLLLWLPLCLFPPPSSEVGLLSTASPYVTCLLGGHDHKATRLLWPLPQARCGCHQPSSLSPGQHGQSAESSWLHEPFWVITELVNSEGTYFFLSSKLRPRGPYLSVLSRWIPKYLGHLWSSPKLYSSYGHLPTPGGQEHAHFYFVR